MGIFGGFDGFDFDTSGYGLGDMGGEYAGPPRSGGSGASKGQVEYLTKRVARLEMVCEALWTLVKEQHGLSDEELMGVMAELDLADGKADGQKADTGPVRCPKCDRPNSRRHDYCIYCGETIRTGPF